MACAETVTPVSIGRRWSRLERRARAGFAVSAGFLAAGFFAAGFLAAGFFAAFGAGSATASPPRPRGSAAFFARGFRAGFGAAFASSAACSASSAATSAARALRARLGLGAAAASSAASTAFSAASTASSADASASGPAAALDGLLGGGSRARGLLVGPLDLVVVLRLLGHRTLPDFSCPR